MPSGVIWSGAVKWEVRPTGRIDTYRMLYHRSIPLRHIVGQYMMIYYDLLCIDIFYSFYYVINID